MKIQDIIDQNPEYIKQWALILMERENGDAHAGNPATPNLVEVFKTAEMKDYLNKKYKNEEVTPYRVHFHLCAVSGDDGSRPTLLPRGYIEPRQNQSIFSFSNSTGVGINSNADHDKGPSCRIM
ncbi:MAG: hypothetical protein ACHQAX_03575 [Gammaproteobacteria bacterium]